MPLSIKDDETDRLARQLARETGASITEAVKRALRDSLQRATNRRRRDARIRELERIAERCGALPEVDRRSADEILGYDERGLPR